MEESHFLAGMLRYKNILARARAVYFQDVFNKNNHEYFINFWEDNFRGRGVMGQILAEDPEIWKKEVYASLKRQINANKHFEHWICEYWDKERKKWIALDANTTFLRAVFDIEVGYHLPNEHFEYAFESWQKMRNNENFNPDQYREDEQDGPSHIRAQLLWDFYNLLNHDLAGFDQTTQDAYKFVKEKTFEELTNQELEELDKLADLLSREPTKDELVEFYFKNTTLRLEAAEIDPYSFVFRN